MKNYLQNRKKIEYDDKTIHLIIKRKKCTLKKFEEYIDMLKKNCLNNTNLIGIKRCFTDTDASDDKFIAPIALIILHKKDDLNVMMNYINGNKLDIIVNASKWNWNHNINCK